MKDFMVASDHAIPPQTGSAEFQAFLRTSADYLGLSLDSDCIVTYRQCPPEVPVAGYYAHFANNQRLVSQL